MTAAADLRAFVATLAAAGVGDAIVCPGSRSTPLALALRANPAIRVRVLLDERGAGFFALGLAKATRRPVVVCVTSGTAAANLLPAAVEAFLGRVPLVLLTADRPAELRDRGAPQTIDQVGLFGSHVKWASELPLPDGSPLVRAEICGLAGRAVASALEGPAGPVHLNAPFREPLIPEGSLAPDPAPATPAAAQPVRPAPAPAGSEGAGAPVPPVVELIPGLRTLAPATLAALAERVGRARRGLIAAGPQDDPALPRALARLAAASGFPILADPLSQVRAGPHERSAVLARGDLLLRAGPWRDAHLPDLVIRFGALPTSKPFLQALEAARPDLLVVDGHGGWREPAGLPATHVHADGTWLANALADALTPVPPSATETVAAPALGSTAGPGPADATSAASPVPADAPPAPLAPVAASAVAVPVGGAQAAALQPTVAAPAPAHAPARHADLEITQPRPTPARWASGDQSVITTVAAFGGRAPVPAGGPPGGTPTAPSAAPSPAVAPVPGAARKGVDAAWQRAWISADRAVDQALRGWLAGVEARGETFEGAVFAHLGDVLPPGAILWAGSSMPVRDMDGWLPATARPIRPLANRGANGIDGVVSSALGAAAAGSGHVTLVIGDLSFLHDLNALLTAKLQRLSLTIVVIHNDGGGIFSFLPQATTEAPLAGLPARYEELFGTPHGTRIGPLVEAFGGRHQRVEPADLRAVLASTASAPGLTVLEVRSDRTRNVALHREAAAVAANALSLLRGTGS